MSDDNRHRSRRSVIASIGAVAGLSGVAAASPSERGRAARGAPRDGVGPRGQAPHVGEASGSMELTPENALTSAEVQEYVDEAYANHGRQTAKAMTPPHVGRSDDDPSSIGTNPLLANLTGLLFASQPDPQNWDDVHIFEDTDTLYSNSTGAYLGDTKHVAAVYEARDTYDGENVYGVWHMMRGEEGSSWLSVKTSHMENGIDLPSYYSLHSYDPETERDLSGSGTISLGVERGPLSFGDEVTLGGGVIKPAFETSLGSGGEFRLVFDGCENGTTIVVGLSLFTSEYSFSEYAVDWSWNTQMTTSTYCVWD